MRDPIPILTICVIVSATLSSFFPINPSYVGVSHLFPLLKTTEVSKTASNHVHVHTHMFLCLLSLLHS